MQKYSKTIIAVIGVAFAAATRHFGAGNEVIMDLVLLATALGVYQVPNAE